MNLNKISVSLITLGCSKNLVDAECVTKDLVDAGLNVIDDFTKANIVIINTCGFIESAISEAIDTILQVSDYKKPNGAVEHIVVCGCMAQRFGDDILSQMPEVDIVLGTSHYQDIKTAVLSLYENDDYQKSYISKAGSLEHLRADREVSTSSYAWLKIGEGCRNCCSFCAIPLIRGGFVSRKIEDILEEAQILANKGYKEIILAAQDTTNYGIDLYQKRTLPKLLRELSKIEGISLIRIMYGYIDGIDDELIDEMATNPKVAHYLDLPIQYANNEILKLMNRRDTVELIDEKLTKIRQKIPDVIIRTTVMVGFPGETDEHFNDLISNIKKWEFDRLGCFIFSPQEGTKAFNMENQVPEDIKNARIEEVYRIQNAISQSKNDKRLQTVTQVHIDSISEDGIFYIGRSYGEAPEVDPLIYVVATNDELSIGDFYDVRIVDTSDYELTGVVV